jgi:hypothetical protein
MDSHAAAKGHKQASQYPASKFLARENEMRFLYQGAYAFQTLVQPNALSLLHSYVFLLEE